MKYPSTGFAPSVEEKVSGTTSCAVDELESAVLFQVSSLTISTPTRVRAVTDDDVPVSSTVKIRGDTKKQDEDRSETAENSLGRSRDAAAEVSFTSDDIDTARNLTPQSSCDGKKDFLTEPHGLRTPIGNSHVPIRPKRKLLFTPPPPPFGREGSGFSPVRTGTNDDLILSGGEGLLPSLTPPLHAVEDVMPPQDEDFEEENLSERGFFFTPSFSIGTSWKTRSPQKKFRRVGRTSSESPLPLLPMNRACDATEQRRTSRFPDPMKGLVQRRPKWKNDRQENVAKRVALPSIRLSPVGRESNGGWAQAMSCMLRSSASPDDQRLDQMAVDEVSLKNESCVGTPEATESSFDEVGLDQKKVRFFNDSLRGSLSPITSDSGSSLEARDNSSDAQQGSNKWFTTPSYGIPTFRFGSNHNADVKCDNDKRSGISFVRPLRLSRRSVAPIPFKPIPPPELHSPTEERGSKLDLTLPRLSPRTSVEKNSLLQHATLNIQSNDNNPPLLPFQEFAESINKKGVDKNPSLSLPSF